MDEVKGLIEEEWKKTEKRFPVNWLNKLHSLAEEDAALIYHLPVVGAAVVRLAKNVTLPMADSTSCKDPLDRRIDIDLKKAYQTAGGACRPEIALTSVSNAFRVWTDNVKMAIQQDVPKEDIVKALEELKLSADFDREASIDIIRCSARAMLHTVMFKQTLWVKP